MSSAQNPFSQQKFETKAFSRDWNRAYVVQCWCSSISSLGPLYLHHLIYTWQQVSAKHPVHIYRNAHSNGSHATGEKARYRDFLGPPPFWLGIFFLCASLVLPLSDTGLSPFWFNYTAKVMIDTRLIEPGQQPRSISCPSFSRSMSTRSCLCTLK